MVEAAAELVLETAELAAPRTRRTEPEPVDSACEPEPEFEAAPDERTSRPAFDQPEAGPDPAMLATLARLERLLVAIDAARHL